MDTSDGNGDRDLTVDAYLQDWLELQRHRLQPTSLKSYRGNIRRYLAPRIGEVPLGELDIRQLERLYADLMARGGKDGEPLSRRTVEYAAATLRSALTDAVRTGLLDRNPASLARLPKIDPTSTTEDDDLQVWTAEDVRGFLEQIHDHRLYDLWVVALGTGMRRGELLGLRWQDVDLEGRTIHVRRALQVVDGVARLKRTKTSRSRSLRIGRRVVEVLDRRRRLQEIHREAAGDRWADRWGLVFTEEDGTHLTPINTLDVYAHVLPAMDEVAVERFEERTSTAAQGPSDVQYRCMRRTQMYLTEEQRERVARRAEDAGVSQAEIIRRILDDALGLGDDVSQRVRAVEDTAGLLQDHPDWADWLAEVRGRPTSQRLEDLGL